jgi:hypothetical protein
MLRLLERNIASIEHRLVLIAPADNAVPAVFDKQSLNSNRRRRLLREVQRLRGMIYLEDGALRPEHLSASGRHEAPEDHLSWHLVMLNARRQVSSCVWYREHDSAASVDQLRVRNCPLRREQAWSDVVTSAVESEMARARNEGLRYVEIGGWAVSQASRCTGEGLLLAIGAYSLARLLGGAIGLTTATVRHCSSTILRRLGGFHLESDGTRIPPYYDPHYDCTMELLRFDSREPNPRYASLVELLKAKLVRVSVVADSLRNVALEHCNGMLSPTDLEAEAVA